VARREDPALLTGRGQYVDDVQVPAELGTPLHAYVVRSPVAHARVTSVDVDAARVASGVVAVFTAADLEAAGVGPLPAPEGLPPGSGNPPYPVLASGTVLWAGQPVALVVASSAELAADAAELVDISYTELPAVTTPLAAAALDAPVLHPDLASNVVVRKRIVAGDTDAAFGRAAHRVVQRMVSQRIAPVALEPRGVLAWVSGVLASTSGAAGAGITGGGRLEVRLPTQRPHGARRWLAAILGLPVEQVRVAAGDVGGAFGAKGPLYPDQVAVCFAALTLRRPVKWIEERAESFLATAHGRDQVADLEMAVDADGRITALRGIVHASFGAYFTPNATSSLLARLGPLLPQGYRIDSIDVELIGVLANTTPTAPYRGAGRPEAAYYCERLVDLAARETGLGPVELRRRNFLPPSDFPYRTCTGLVYDSGDYQAGLDLMLAKLGYRDFGAGTGAAPSAAPGDDLADARARLLASTGELLGVGIASFVEPGGITPGGPTLDPRTRAGDAGDKATVTVSPSGEVTVAVGTSGHGQGHETAFAQLAADLLGVAYESVSVVFGDTDTSPFGFGTFGSRSAVAGGTAIYHACQAVLAAAKRADAPMPVAEAAARLGGLSATAASGAPPETYASGSYGCVVAVDPLTGRVRVLRVVAVDDCGVVINPLLVEGQVHGAIAQGLGQALSEQVLYDAAGQPMSGSLMDYAVPFAASMPAVLESYLLCTPSPANPLGVKGMGESGTIGVTPALVNAVMDALSPYGIRHLDMPLTAEKVWTAIQSASASQIGYFQGPCS
jgi:carbon-monoxide dehydrogenase large subunit